MLSPGHVKGHGSKTHLRPAVASRLQRGLPARVTRGDMGTPGLGFGSCLSGRGRLGQSSVLWLGPWAGGFPAAPPRAEDT